MLIIFSIVENNLVFIKYVFFFIFFAFFFFFRATPTAYGSSQAKGRIGAVAASLHHSTTMWDPSHICDLHHSSQQCRIPDPLSKARDQTGILMDASRVHFCCTMVGTPFLILLKYNWSITLCKFKGTTY